MDHTGFHCGMVGLGVLSKVCFFERPFFITPYTRASQKQWWLKSSLNFFISVIWYDYLERKKTLLNLNLNSPPVTNYVDSHKKNAKKGKFQF